MAKKDKPEYVQAVTSFRVASPEGQPYKRESFNEGDTVPSDHRIAKKYPHLFGPVRETVKHVKKAVEQATNAPGEVRTVSSPDDLEEYHQGSGWYEIDGEKVRGEEAARELLEKGK